MRVIGRGAWGWAAGACAALLALSACEKAASTAARNHPEDRAGSASGRDDDRGYASSRSEGSRPDEGRGSYASDRGGEGGGSGYGRERADTPMFHGEPLWSDNRQHTAQENADYHCKKSGPDIGATGLDDCLTKVHAFIDHPPTGVETLTRANGDKLLYDPQANLFAVARKDGAPRTFFKPTTGAAYWAQQKTRESEGGGYGGRRSHGGSGDEGAGAGA